MDFLDTALQPEYVEEAPVQAPGQSIPSMSPLSLGMCANLPMMLKALYEQFGEVPILILSVGAEKALVVAVNLIGPNWSMLKLEGIDACLYASGNGISWMPRNLKQGN